MEQWETDLVAEFQAILPSGTHFAVHAEKSAWVVDIVRGDGSVVWPHFGGGSDQFQALNTAWRRYVVEQLGLGAWDRIYENGKNERIRQFLGRAQQD